MRYKWTVFALFLVLAACNYTLKIKDGKTAYAQKRYAEATKLLQTEYSKAQSRVEKGKIAWLLAESYRQLRNEEKAANWYQKSVENSTNVEALRELAQSLKRQEKYKEAAETFKNLGIEIGSPYEVKKDILSCNTALTWLEDVPYTGIKVEAVSFNTAAADYAPAVAPDGAVVFTSDRAASTGKEMYAWTGAKFADLFQFSNDRVTPFEGLNTPFNDATAAFNKDGTQVVFVRSGGTENETTYCTQLYYSEKRGLTWSEPELLPFCKETVNYGTPSVSADGKTLFFAANDPEGWGGYDLYVCQKNMEGFIEPRILSRTINTVGNDMYPTIEGDTLYFSSDTHLGMGGLDIFKSVKGKDGNWTTPVNLKAPINSGADDFGFVVDNISPKKDGIWAQGYFTSNRLGDKGNDDIYKYERGQAMPKPQPPIVEKPKNEVITYKNIIDIIVLEKIFAQADNPNSRMIGKKPLSEAVVKVTVNGKTRDIRVNTEGVASLDLADNSDYNFTAQKSDYLNNQASFSSKGLGKDPNNPIQRFELEIVLDKIYKDKEIVLENIYYDYNKADIRDDAQPTLNALSAVLVQNPNIRIQLSSHTDCRGKDDYNATLSQKRAESAVNYLISRGIAPERLVAKGYGETLPAVVCDCAKCSEEQHQANRRTTFKIIE